MLEMDFLIVQNFAVLITVIIRVEVSTELLNLYFWFWYKSSDY